MRVEERSGRARLFHSVASRSCSAPSANDSPHPFCKSASHCVHGLRLPTHAAIPQREHPPSTVECAVPLVRGVTHKYNTFQSRQTLAKHVKRCLAGTPFAIQASTAGIAYMRSGPRHSKRAPSCAHVHPVRIARKEGVPRPPSAHYRPARLRLRRLAARAQPAARRPPIASASHICRNDTAAGWERTGHEAIRTPPSALRISDKCGWGIATIFGATNPGEDSGTYAAPGFQITLRPVQFESPAGTASA
ncbi:hypothetical protein B0H11DRAFT_2250523 [Mycena galericulata]|nr:hypothetical protein B0H11DRAFT_2250523 [Mycena galericulata]